MKKVLLGLSLLVSGSLAAQTEVLKMNEAKSSNQGLAYSLPKTVLQVNLTTYKVTRTAGPYYKYAERYLGVKDPITENSVEWSLDNVTINSTAVPDLEHSYLILFRSTPAPTIDLTSDGMIRSLNMEYVEEKSSSKPDSSTEAKDELNDSDMKVMSEDLLMAGSTGKMAETAAKHIYKIRESRTDLITGNMDNLPADGESYKLMLKQLDDQEKALTTLFVGSVKREKKLIEIEVTPTEDVEKQVIGRFSRFSGSVDKNDLSGTPIYLSIKTIEKRELPIDPKENKGKKGIYYRIPAKVQVTLTGLNNHTYAKTTTQVAQMGSVVSLSPNLFENKKAPVKILFDPSLGSIRQMTQ